MSQLNTVNVEKISSEDMEYVITLLLFLNMLLNRTMYTALLYLTHPSGRIFFSELLGWKKKL